MRPPLRFNVLANVELAVAVSPLKKPIVVEVELPHDCGVNQLPTLALPLHDCAITVPDESVVRHCPAEAPRLEIIRLVVEARPDTASPNEVVVPVTLKLPVTVDEPTAKKPLRKPRVVDVALPYAVGVNGNALAAPQHEVGMTLPDELTVRHWPAEPLRPVMASAEVVAPPVMNALPATDRVWNGEVVPIPTLPAKYALPVVVAPPLMVS